MGAITVTDQTDPILADDSDDDRAYFGRRAAWHERQAGRAGDSSTQTLHRRFARIYADRSLPRSST